MATRWNNGGRRRYGVGRDARDAQAIADHCARMLRRRRPDDPRRMRAAIVAAARTCPLVGNERHALAVADGWEGAYEPAASRGHRALVCRSAGRQLAFIIGVLL